MISDLEVEKHTNKGDYSFQEYATCNWIYHLRSSIDFLADNLPKGEEAAFKASYNLLRRLHAQYYTQGHVTPEIFDFAEQRSLLKTELKELAKIYCAASIFRKDPSNGMYRMNEILIVFESNRTDRTHSSFVGADRPRSSQYRTILTSSIHPKSRAFRQRIWDCCIQMLNFDLFTFSGWLHVETTKRCSLETARASIQV
jgi:hypothetical protein